MNSRSYSKQNTKNKRTKSVHKKIKKTTKKFDTPQKQCYINSITNNNNTRKKTMTTLNNNNSINGNNTMNTQVFSHYDTLVKTLTFKTGSAETAHDIAMDGLIKACDKVDQFDSSKGSLKNFVYTVVMNNLRDFYKSHAVKMTGSGYDADQFDTLVGGYDVDFGSDDNKDADVFGIAQTILNEKEYNVLVAYFQNELKYREIADTLDMPIGSVMSALNGAKNKLKCSPKFARFNK